MYPDRKRLYMVAALFPCALLLAAFVPDLTAGKYLLAALAAGFAAAGWYLIPRRSVPAITRREVTLVMAVMGPVAVMLYYLTGLRFGFYSTPVQAAYLWKYIIPYLILIPAAEIFRSVMLQQKKPVVTALAYITMVLLDSMAFSRTGVLENFTRFREFMAMVLFPAVTGNILYHYLSARNGAVPNIIYRLVMALYPYLLAKAPGTPQSMLAFGRLIAPLLICLFVRYLYEKRKFVQSRYKTVAGTVGSCVLLAAMAAVIMLISCQFRFGLLVVGSESMAGSIDKGDAIIYEEYTGQPLEIGQVAVFKQGKTTYIHRIADITRTDGELRIYTKGDANEAMDSGYVTQENMVGVVKQTVKYIGYPTIWSRQLFQ